jgi:hypothetical protein
MLITFLKKRNLQKKNAHKMSFQIFDTSYASNNQEILRWSSIAVASFLTVVVLIWGAMVFTGDPFKADVEAAASRDATRDLDDLTGANTLMRRLVIAMFFMITVASTFLSWYVASLHMAQNNLIALDVINFVIVMLLSLAAYLYYKSDRKRGAASAFIGSAAALEFVALILLLASPTAAGSDGVLTQSALYVPLLIATMNAMSR